MDATEGLCFRFARYACGIGDPSMRNAFFGLQTTIDSTYHHIKEEAGRC